MMLATFVMARRFVVDGCFSEEVRALTAIVPGSCFAIAALHMVLLHPCDVVLAEWPGLRLAKYVDDVALSAQGANVDVAYRALGAFDRLRALLEGGLQLEVSVQAGDKAGKSVALASNAWLWRHVGRALLARGIPLQVLRTQPRG